MSFDDARPLGQSQNLIIRQGVPLAIALIDRHIPGQLAAPDVIHHLDFFAAQVLLQNGPETLCQCRLKD